MAFGKQRPSAPWSQGNYWGQYDSPSQLPNVGGAPLQLESVQAGDVAWSSSDASLYVCTNPARGAATWEKIASSTAGTNVTRDAHVLVVGAPGEDPDLFDFIEPGDGSGIKAALADAATRSLPVDVRLRPMQITVDAANLPLIVTQNVRLIGAGSQGPSAGSLNNQSTIIRGPTTGEQTILVLEENTDLRSLHVVSPTPTGATSTLEGGVITCTGSGGQSVVEVSGQLQGDIDRSAFQMLRVETPDNVIVRDCDFDADATFVNAGTASACIVLLGSSAFAQVINTIVRGGDHGISLFGTRAGIYGCNVSADIIGINGTGTPARDFIAVDNEVRVGSPSDPGVPQYGIQVFGSAAVEYPRVIGNYVLMENAKNATIIGIRLDATGAGLIQEAIVNANAVDCASLAGSTGLRIGTGCDRALATSNQLRRAATPLSDAGAGTVAANNITV